MYRDSGWKYDTNSGLSLSRDIGRNKSLITIGIAWNRAWERVLNSLLSDLVESLAQLMVCSGLLPVTALQQSVLVAAGSGCPPPRCHLSAYPVVVLIVMLVHIAFFSELVEHLVTTNENHPINLDKTKSKRPFWILSGPGMDTYPCLCFLSDSKLCSTFPLR